MTIRLAAAAALVLGAAACAEPPRQDRETAASADRPADRPAPDASASSPMTVNPAPAGEAVQGQATPQTPPTLPEDPAQQDTSMPPGPVNPPR